MNNKIKLKSNLEESKHMCFGSIDMRLNLTIFGVN